MKIINNCNLPLNKDIPHSTETKPLTYIFETVPNNYYNKKTQIVTYKSCVNKKKQCMSLLPR